MSFLLAACEGSGGDGGTSLENDSVSVDSGPAVTYVTTETFDEEVLQADVPVLVDFTATWCVPCKVVDPIIMSLYPEMAGRAKVFKLDIDEDPEIYRRLGVNGVPHILFFNNGEEQDRIVSPQPREIYVQYLEALIDGRSTLEVSLQLLQEDAFRRHFILTRRMEDLETALEEYPGLLSEPLENGQTPLSMILNRPNYRQDEQIEFALAHGAQPTTRDLPGLGRCDEFLAALVDDPEALGRNVVLLQDPALIAEFLDRGLDPLQSDENGWNMLHWAASYGYADVVRLFADRGMDLDATNHKGETAARIVRDRRDRTAKALEDGVDSYGRKVEEEARPYYLERIAASDELLVILEA
jgi:thioredoxin 1